MRDQTIKDALGSYVERHRNFPTDDLTNGGSISSSEKENADDDDDDDADSNNEPAFLVWRRLHLSKAKLRGVTEMAALMAGFSVVATVELQIRAGTSEYLLTAFAITTAFLITTTMLSIMIATCILPHLEAVAKLNSVQLVRRSPHDALIKYIDLSWVLANTFSIFLFIVDVILLCWIKFESFDVCIAFTAVMIPVLIILCVFSVVFYRQSVQHQYKIIKGKCDELEAMNDILNNPMGSGNNSRAHSLQNVHHV